MTGSQVGFLGTIVFLAGSFWWNGCCREVRTYPPPKPGNLVKQVQYRNRRAQSLKAVVKADQLTKKGRVKLKVFLLIKQPGKLRFEATVMDNTVAVLTADGHQFASIDFKKHIVYRGPASPCNIARIFNIPLTGQQVAVVLSGGVPVLRHDAVKLRWDKCKGREVLILKNNKLGLTQYIYLKRRHGQWQMSASKIKDKKGKTMLRISARDFRKRSGIWVPRWIHFVHPKKKADVMMRFIAQSVNVDVPEDAFHIKPPDKLPVRWLQCRAAAQLPFLPVIAQADRNDSHRPPHRKSVPPPRPAADTPAGRKTSPPSRPAADTPAGRKTSPPSRPVSDTPADRKK
jgi:outer membrane lipoprotein-sorting protein